MKKILTLKTIQNPEKMKIKLKRKSATPKQSWRTYFWMVHLKRQKGRSKIFLNSLINPIENSQI